MIVEDDSQIGRRVLTALRAGGHEATWLQTGSEALAAAKDEDIDLALLDIGLPDIDGIELCRKLRILRPLIVIVMLTANRDEMDVVSALESGADDYLTKPFRMIELQARVRAHLRRALPNASTKSGRVEVGALTLDRLARRCWLGIAEVPLRAKEFDLLERLTQSAGVAVPREVLMAEVWDENWFGSTKTLDVHVASLRRKLYEAAHVQRLAAPEITTLRGHGYRLESSTSA